MNPNTKQIKLLSQGNHFGDENRNRTHSNTELLPTAELGRGITEKNKDTLKALAIGGVAAGAMVMAADKGEALPVVPSEVPAAVVGEPNYSVKPETLPEDPTQMTVNVPELPDSK